MNNDLIGIQRGVPPPREDQTSNIQTRQAHLQMTDATQRDDSSLSFHSSPHITDNFNLDGLINLPNLNQLSFAYQHTNNTHQQATITNTACLQCVPNYNLLDEKSKQESYKRIKDILRTKHSFQISDSDKLKYRSTIYPNTKPLTFIRYYSKYDELGINYLELHYYCGYKPKCKYNLIVQIYPSYTHKKAI